MSGAVHQNRGRALSFGGVAELYDRARPGYPAELVDDLVRLGPQDVLDVGTGTAKAARLLAARGLRVVGVEPDPRMAALARSHGIAVEEGTFERWDPAGRSFDLITAGQSWHWIDPGVGIPKAASLLRRQGHLAAFWNIGSHDAAVRAALQPVYERFAPEIATTTTALGIHDDDDPDRQRQLAGSGRFSSVELRSYLWEEHYSTARWLDFLATHSDHVLLPAAQRAALLEAVGQVLDRLGGSLTFHYVTVLILAARAA